MIVTLENAIANLLKFAETPHRFRFVSAAQSLPYAIAISRWEKSGRSAEQPMPTAAEMRAAIYDQAESASELRAFCKVASVIGVELGEVAIAGLKAGHIVVAYTALRGFIERTAYANSIAEKVSQIKSAPLDGPLTPVLELSELIHRSLYATQRDWVKLVKADFRKTTAKEMKYVKKENIADIASKNILNAIDELDKRIAGTRLTYEILCEYLHPNVGDLWAATLQAESFIDSRWTRHLFRTIGLGQKTLEGLPDQQVLNEKLYDICNDIVPLMPSIIIELDSISQRATRLTRRFAHGVVKNYRKQFSGSDLCPCLSGLTVAACTGLRS